MNKYTRIDLILTEWDFKWGRWGRMPNIWKQSPERYAQYLNVLYKK